MNKVKTFFFYKILGFFMSLEQTESHRNMNLNSVILCLFRIATDQSFRVD